MNIIEWLVTITLGLLILTAFSIVVVCWVYVGRG